MMPSGERMTVSTSSTPATTVYQSPNSKLRSRATKRMPPDANTPAATPPDTDVIPARYAVAKIARPSVAL